YPNVSSVKQNTYELLKQSTAAMVTSGTATLETALFAVPEIVCYKAGNISYQIGKRLVKIKFISLVNLILDKLVVKELIQNEMTAENITKELKILLSNIEHQDQLQQDYKQLKELLSKGGNASQKAAKSIFDLINN
ncbi:MAG: lipid-A-disaccharide synthase, partial [Bacteroidota bacterium]